MDNRPGASAVRSLPVPQRLVHAAFTRCVILSLYHLLKLNDDYDDDDDYIRESRCPMCPASYYTEGAIIP